MTLVNKFIKGMEAEAGRVHRLGKIGNVPGFIAGLLADMSFPNNIVASPALQALDWNGLKPEFRPGKIADRVGITRAIAGIAETGTLVFSSDKDNLSSLNFVPELSFAILREKEIVATQEDVWALFPKTTMPATINLVTGPSRTGDIEQTLYLGAHGPKELHVLLIKGVS